jgi:hypothetical protein
MSRCDCCDIIFLSNRAADACKPGRETLLTPPTPTSDCTDFRRSEGCISGKIFIKLLQYSRTIMNWVSMEASATVRWLLNVHCFYLLMQQPGNFTDEISGCDKFSALEEE